ncbi:MAG: SH3 domain-containing protein [Candidatus Dormibacteraeota bacterium]|nr:SH3 domain-containing protein [Candidatus Dormibacteraeota bacterium]
MSDPGSVHVIASHRPSSTAPIEVRPGDRVTVHERDDEWPAFVKVTTSTGDSGWVPSRHLAGTSGDVEVIAPYNTQELAADPGEMLSVIERDDESGWHWCRNDRGHEGWIPIRSLEP